MAFTVVANFIDMIVLQDAVGHVIQGLRATILGKLQHALSVGRCQHSASRCHAEAQHYGSPTGVGHSLCLAVIDADAVLRTHHQMARGGLSYRIDTVVEDGLRIIGHMLIDSNHRTSRTCDVNTSRIGTHDNVTPNINNDCIDTIAVQHAVHALIGIEEQCAAILCRRTALHLIHAQAVNAHQHGVHVIGTEGTHRILRLDDMVFRIAAASTCRLVRQHPGTTAVAS